MPATVSPAVTRLIFLTISNVPSNKLGFAMPISATAVLSALLPVIAVVMLSALLIVLFAVLFLRPQGTSQAPRHR